jgi:hypothetical protein
LRISRRVDEDRPVQILGLEAVGRGIELRMGLDGLEAERVQVGLQVAAHPVGPDHHQRPDRIQSGRADVLCGDVPVADHAGGHGLGTAAVSGQVRTTARPAVEAGQQGPGLVVQIGEKAAPERIDRLGIVLKGLIELGHHRGVGTVKRVRHGLSPGGAGRTSRATTAGLRD